MDKLKCITTLNGEFIPLNAISKISPIEEDVHYIWTNDGHSYNLTKDTYVALIHELHIIK